MKNLPSSLRVAITIVLVSIFAQFSIDVGSIPITGQTFAITTCAIFLTPKESFISLLLYVILGAFGLPLFANGESGFEKITGGSGGFLVGFIVAAPTISYLTTKRSISFFKCLFIISLGTFIILFFGIGRLTNLYGMEKGLEYGFYPFWKGAIVKIVLSAITCFVIEKYVFFPFKK